ncbi:hypothetical protein I6N95_15265 [Vagococcus sp. BWB3-3]|uniref:Uncharacterized protein n=1 Tax=Vagococcus allomyrinae TaxID=2794353 RepID=A0A940P682_9ENTE|nr:hypothetical protein [Vagococcus allomyrinae]MBP1042379.1 hypothetical protein [Vagococcus allomyrinae]
MIRRLINNFVEPYRKKNGGLIVRPNDAPLLEQQMVEVKPEGQLWDILCLVAFGIIISGVLAVFWLYVTRNAMRGKQIVVSGGQDVGRATAAAASFMENARQTDLLKEAVRDKGPGDMVLLDVTSV